MWFMWFFQGFRRILLITLGMDGDESTAVAVKRLEPTGKKDGHVLVCSLQKNEQFRAFCARKSKMKEHGRSEWGSLALARFFFPDRFNPQKFSLETSTVPDSKSFRQWHKRGRDPQKLRKMTPAMRLSGFNGSVSPEEAEEHHKKFFERSGWKLLDPANIEARIKKVQSEIDDFNEQIDAQLSMANANTEIEVDFITE